ncbi:hypothetical protein MMB75_07110 [Paenibacillus sp. P2(2022)]|uniref:hypothetical protein n=1 Tax=Paenibacillus TaxID=44249 RepID=UPI001C9E0178|nr:MULTISPECIES: hypothetical protein [Paenibacillus]MBY7736741.1 hypothetical protein [Paenibacillus polymyxa]MDG0053437.1 hypothetical protein [Paenibacillus sp. P2(2022)]
MNKDQLLTNWAKVNWSKNETRQTGGRFTPYVGQIVTATVDGIVWNERIFIHSSVTLLNGQEYVTFAHVGFDNNGDPGIRVQRDVNAEKIVIVSSLV